MNRLEKSKVVAYVGAWSHAQATDKLSCFIRKYVAEHVTSNQDIEVLRFFYQPHACRIHVQLVKRYVWVLLGDFSADACEQAVGYTHNIGFVNRCNLPFSVTQPRHLKGFSRYALAVPACDYS